MLDIPPAITEETDLGQGTGPERTELVTTAEVRALTFIIEGSSMGGMETPAEKDNVPYKTQIIIRSFDQDPK